MNSNKGNDRRELALVDADGVEALLDALAVSIAPRIAEGTALVGIVRRGKPLAQMLAERLKRDHGKDVELGELALKRYSDSLELLYDRPNLDADTLDIEIEDRHLILVDDVLYTGETMFRAACYLRGAGATHLQTAFLCARPGLKVPLHADFVGARFDIGADWVIHCEVPPYDERLGITIAHQDALRE